MPSPAVPIVDLFPFTSRDPQLRQHAAEDLARKVQVNGCVGITGHGISPELLQQAFQVTKGLFELPYEKKMKAPHPDSTVPHRGYSGTNREKPSAKTALETDDQEKQEDYLEMAADYKACVGRFQERYCKLTKPHSIGKLRDWKRRKQNPI